MRSFLSYDVEEPSLLSRIRDFQRKLLATGADLKLVRPELMHFTIRFLGEIDERQKEEIISSLEGKVPKLELEVKFRGLGAFPSDKRISVIWLGSAEDSTTKLVEQAAVIKRTLDQKVSSLRGEPDDKFNPHLTIARVKSGRNKAELVKFLSEHSKDDFGSARIGPLKLKMSVLAREGPTYSDLHVFS